MAVPQPAMVLPREITHETVVLPHKPGASVHYSLVRCPKNDDQSVLVVFLNGLMSDKSSWLSVMAGIIRQRKGTSAGFPSMLAYDRYGQGLTEDRDPQDQGREEGHGHNVADAANDLRHLILQICGSDSKSRVVLVGNSIGCAVARLYAQGHSVAGLLLLDSIMANSDFDLWPNPAAPGFDEKDLPEDVSVSQLMDQRDKFLAIFRPDKINREGLSRRDLASLLPQSDGPILGTETYRPWVSVVGHDFETFAEESLRTMGTPKSLSMRYSNPAWHRYNQGLARLTEPHRSRGPMQAKGCGHFIQKDDPNFVVDAALDLVDEVRLEKSLLW